MGRYIEAAFAGSANDLDGCCADRQSTNDENGAIQNSDDDHCACEIKSAPKEAPDAVGKVIPSVGDAAPVIYFRPTLAAHSTETIREVDPHRPRLPRYSILLTCSTLLI